MSATNSQAKIRQFVKDFVDAKKGTLTEQSDSTFTIQYRNQPTAAAYTYDPAVSRENKTALMTPGSAAFQQILSECTEKGVLCQVLLSPKAGFEAYLKGCFQDSPLLCTGCDKLMLDGDSRIYTKTGRCSHKVNNAKIVNVKTAKKDPARYFQFYYSCSFQNKVRSKNEELIAVTLDEECAVVNVEELSQPKILMDEKIDVKDFKAKISSAVFIKLKAAADQKINALVREKLAVFDLPLYKEITLKLRSFDKRLRRERLEASISHKRFSDQPTLQANYEALMKREEESYLTNISVKLINLLIINTAKVTFEVSLDNGSAIRGTLTLGIDEVPDVVCPICRSPIFEGYATEDHLYVCRDCIRQSVDTGKVYSRKAALRLDETLNEYFEQESGFVCSVCGKKHSRLLEFKCSYDDSSVCIYHYELCDVCGKIFSKLNLKHTDEFKRKLCPAHAAQYRLKET